MEERLLSSAFYNMSMQLNRNAVEARLAHVSPGGQGHQQGQSFLARQRQVMNRQSNAAPQANKPGANFNSSDFLEY